MSLIPVFVSGWPLVLLPVRIAFLELIIDPACSEVFEAEEIDPEIMGQPPRGRGARMFDRRVLTIAGLQGLSMLLVVLGVYLWSVLSGRPEDVVRSMTFATLVIGNLSLILVNRSWRLPAMESLRHRRNRALKWILSAAGALLVVLLTVPWLRDAFSLWRVSPWDWLVALVAALAGVTWFEIYKLLARR